MSTQNSNIEIWQIGVDKIHEYDKIPMLVNVNSILKPTKIDGGLGGITFQETIVNEYVKDLAQYDNKADTLDKFDTSNWAIFMAYVDKMPIGGVIVATKTEDLDMLDGRDDLAVLWDLRVNDRYKRRGVGKQLFAKAVEWAQESGMKEMKIECQNNNVNACYFYAKRGAVLAQINEYAYYKVKELRNEIQMIWYLNLQ